MLNYQRVYDILYDMYGLRFFILIRIEGFDMICSDFYGIQTLFQMGFQLGQLRSVFRFFSKFLSTWQWPNLGTIT